MSGKLLARRVTVFECLLHGSTGVKQCQGSLGALEAHSLAFVIYVLDAGYARNLLCMRSALRERIPFDSINTEISIDRLLKFLGFRKQNE